MSIRIEVEDRAGNRLVRHVPELAELGLTDDQLATLETAIDSLIAAVRAEHLHWTVGDTCSFLAGEVLHIWRDRQGYEAEAARRGVLAL